MIGSPAQMVQASHDTTYRQSLKDENDQNSGAQYSRKLQICELDPDPYAMLPRIRFPAATPHNLAEHPPRLLRQMITVHVIPNHRYK